MSSLLITNGRLVTLDEDDRFIENGSIYIEGGRIVDVGEFAVGTYSADRTIDAWAYSSISSLDVSGSIS